MSLTGRPSCHALLSPVLIHLSIAVTKKGKGTQVVRMKPDWLWEALDPVHGQQIPGEQRW